MKTDMNSFVLWQAEKPESRSVEIKVDPTRWGQANNIKVWVYDYDLQQGQHVTCVEDIDLEGEVKKAELRKLAELKAKYEPGE